jgi:hypothetical protein
MTDDREKFEKSLVDFEVAAIEGEMHEFQKVKAEVLGLYDAQVIELAHHKVMLKEMELAHHEAMDKLTKTKNWWRSKFETLKEKYDRLYPFAIEKRLPGATGKE